MLVFALNILRLIVLVSSISCEPNTTSRAGRGIESFTMDKTKKSKESLIKGVLDGAETP